MPKGVYERRSVEERLEDRTTYEPNMGCWLWTGPLRGDHGYGVIWHEGRNRPTHIVTYELAKGCRVPRGRVLLHSCDQPTCRNPGHLRPGTQLANMRDKVAKGRQASGSRNGAAKLNETRVRAIREQLAAGVPLRQVARDHGVHPETVRDIHNGRTWRKACCS